MDEYERFLSPADEWFINYSLPPAHLAAVRLFSIGQAVELYLKAAYTKITGDSAKAIGFGHGIPAIWKACKEQDAAFMVGYDLREHIVSVMDASGGSWLSRLSKEDRENYLTNMELYLVAKFLRDLKYLGAPPKSRSGPQALGYCHPNDYWISFVKAMRAYLGHPRDGRSDEVRYCLERRLLPPESAAYLRSLYG